VRKERYFGAATATSWWTLYSESKQRPNNAMNRVQRLVDSVQKNREEVTKPPLRVTNAQAQSLSTFFVYETFFSQRCGSFTAKIV
jgi:hypothetical protein